MPRSERAGEQRNRRWIRTADRTTDLSFADHLRVWGPAALWAAVLFFLSSIPEAGGPGWFPVSDKVVHAALYAVLGGTLAYGRTRSIDSLGRSAAATHQAKVGGSPLARGGPLAHGWLLAQRWLVVHGWLLALGLLYALSDEWHQAFVPGRTPEAADWLADAVGLVAGYGTTWVLLGRTRDDDIRNDLHDRDAS